MMRVDSSRASVQLVEILRDIVWAYVDKEVLAERRGVGPLTRTSAAR